MQLFLTFSVAITMVSALTQDSRASSAPYTIYNVAEDQDYAIDLQELLFRELTEAGNRRLGFSEEEKLAYAAEVERWLSERKEEVYPIDFAQILNSASLTEEQRLSFNFTEERKEYLDSVLDIWANQTTIDDEGDLFTLTKDVQHAFYLGNYTLGENDYSIDNSVLQDATSSTVLQVNGYALNSSVTSSIDAEGTLTKGRKGPVVIGDHVTSAAAGFNGTEGLRNESNNTLTRDSGGISVKALHQTSAVLGGAFVAAIFLLL